VNRQLRTIANFSKSVMVSVTASTLGRLHLVFINPAWSKNQRNLLSRCSDGTSSSTCCRKFMTLEGCFILQQDSAVSHRAI